MNTSPHSPANAPFPANTSPTADADLLSTAWSAALPWPAYLESVQDKRELWHANWQRATVHADV